MRDIGRISVVSLPDATNPLWLPGDLPPPVLRLRLGGLVLRKIRPGFPVVLEQSNEAFRQHFLRIETHHLKHLAIETLLRMFLGHRRFPACPWYEISKLTNPGKFKDIVRKSIVEAEPDDLQSAVLDVLLGRSGDLTTATDSDLDTSDNLSGFLRSFATDWLNEAKSYNATKHGLTAIPGAAHVKNRP